MNSENNSHEWPNDWANAATASGGAPVGPMSEEEEEEWSAGSDHGPLLVSGRGAIRKPKHYNFLAPVTVLGAADIESLATAVRWDGRCCSSLPERILFSFDDPDQFDPAFSDVSDVHLEVGADFVHAVISCVAMPDRFSDYRSFIEPAIKRRGCVLASVHFTDEYGTPHEETLREANEFRSTGFLSKKDYENLLDEQRSKPCYVEVRVSYTTPIKVESIVSAGLDVLALLKAVQGGPLRANSAANLLRSGHAELLIGLQEGAWFEVKSQAYGLQAPGETGTAAKIELAQDVARFANGDCDALLVLGLATEKNMGREVVSEVKPVKTASVDLEQYQQVIDDRVYPTIDGLIIESVPVDGNRTIVSIFIPRQPAEYHPFLVHGAIVGDKVEGAFISIVRRRGEASIPTTASQIHTMLATGRALLRGHLPNPRDGIQAPHEQ